ncbi:phosphatase PAP2 family protein [archaeon]|nr:phosphatase PAP2 family protein [archaeon]
MRARMNKRRDVATGSVLLLVTVLSFIFNQQLFNSITAMQQPWLNPFMIGMTGLVELWLGLPILFLVILALGNRKAFLSAALVVVVDILVILGLKMFFDKPRPAGGLVAADLSSFPSGHSSRAFAFFSTVGEYYARFAWLFLALAALIAFSRVYLGVHYPRDVAAGALLGFVISRAVIYSRVGERLYGNISKRRKKL